MGTAVGGEATRIAGRAREQQLLRQAVGRSAQGTPCTLLVHGEAGVGKTRLVSDTAERSRAAGHIVLEARCLRFGAGSSPYHPFISAFEGLLAEHDPAPALDLAPLYGGERAGELPASALHVIDRSVALLAAEGPVVLVVDDLQWADTSSLDALAYLLAGLRRQPVAVLITYRDEGIPDGHPLHGWLADVLRLPGVVDAPLARLTVEETAEQLGDLWGTTPRPALVAEVWERSAGNAYLTELLARDVDPDGDSLPADIPDALRTALLARWHGLSASARVLTQVLAVAGRPADPEVLGAVAGRAVTRGPGVEAALREATVAGVVQTDRSGLVWFRHPLLSDVLYPTLLPQEARALHAGFVDVLSEVDGDLRAHADLALHYGGAAMFDASFEQCLRAAEEAKDAMVFPEAAVLLRHACDLWPEVSSRVRARSGSWAALLAESAQVLRLTGDARGAIEQLDRALPMLDERADPVTASRVIRLRGQVAFSDDNLHRQPVDRLREAVRISAAAPDSDEHAFALADLADAELYNGELAAAREHAQRAVEVAERSGDLGARAYTLSALANARMVEDDAEQLAREALRLAIEAHHPGYAGVAAIALANVLDSHGRFEEVAEVMIAAHARGPGYVGMAGLLGTYAAVKLLPLGRLREARATLREVLAARPAGIVGIQARAAAAVAAVRSGDLVEATAHLDRVHELDPGFTDYVGLRGPAAQVEYWMAFGRAEESLQLLERSIQAHATADPKFGDTLLLWAARAAAALPPARRSAALQAVLDARARCPVPAFAGGDTDPGQRAVEALFLAERARCLGEPDVVDRWRAAVPLADATGLRFAAAEARLRLAESLLASRNRHDAGPVLREAHSMSEDMGALRLRDEIGLVAAAGRISLAEPDVPQQRSVGPDHGLTQREREVLAHLMVGRTYREIAGALFISEKTVSVHVSNLLRKTGTTSRIEAAAWGRRSGVVPPEDC